MMHALNRRPSVQVTGKVLTMSPQRGQSRMKSAAKFPNNEGRG